MRSRWLILLAAAACSDGGGPHSLSTSGTAGVPAAAAVASNLLFTDVAADGHGGVRMLVDTGAPFTLVDRTAFGLTPPTGSDAQIAALTVGQLTWQHPPTLATTAVVQGSLPFIYGGILGANLICQYPTTFDYRAAEVRVGRAADTAGDLAPPITIAFRLSGGGVIPSLTKPITYPATRIPIDVLLEGKVHHLIADTGASEITLRAAAFDALAADGRAQLNGLPVGTVGGSQSARATRLRTVVLGGAEVDGVVALALESEALFDNLAHELGHPVDGVLGGDFWREFQLTIDYPKGQLQLRRYPTRDHIRDEFSRVGVLLVDPDGGPPPHQYQVGTVFAGSDAAQAGLQAGDAVLSIDGADLSTLDSVSVDSLLLGAPGETRVLGRDGSALGPLTVRVEQLLPL